MKQGKSLITFVMAALAVALMIYLGFYVFRTFNDPYSTTTVYAYTATDSIKADGTLIREETVLPGQGGIADVIRGEGEKVGVGQTVALVYPDSKAQADQAELDGLASEIALLEQAAVGSGNAETTASLDDTILDAVVSLRAASALGDFNTLETMVRNIKSGILRRSYTYEDGISASDLSARMAELTSRYNSLITQTETATTRVRAEASGTFSGHVDGYENTLTPEKALQFTPSLLRAARQSTGTVNGQEIGKLITSDRWYFAANFPVETADRLSEGKTATLRFTGDFDQDVKMRVDSISSEEDGEKTVVFSSDRYMSRTTLLRWQTAELIFSSNSGLRIPKEALKYRNTSAPDTSSSSSSGSSSGSSSSSKSSSASTSSAASSGSSSASSSSGTDQEDRDLGVYALMAGRVEFKPAEVISTGDDFYVVRAASTGSKALRAGDEILVRGTGFFDGQLLEY